MKLTKRKGFNFFRSYYDVYNELEKPADKLAFIDALLNKQFQGVEPNDLKGMAKFAWVSQINSIDSQVKGYETKTGLKLTPCLGATVGGSATPTRQVQVQEKGKGQYSQPTIKEISSYMTEKNYPNEAERFFDFYTSKGWMVGKNKMKDWKAAVRNWCRDKQNKDSNGYSDGKLQY